MSYIQRMFFASLLLCASDAVAAPADDWGQYIGHLRGQQVPIFLSECSIQKNDVALIVFPVGGKEGYFFEVQDRPDRSAITLNFSSVAISKGQLVPPELAFGGEYTLRHLEDVIRFLIKSKFRMVMPAELSSMQLGAAAIPCP